MTWSTLLLLRQCSRLQLFVITDTNMWCLQQAVGKYLKVCWKYFIHLTASPARGSTAICPPQLVRRGCWP